MKTSIRVFHWLPRIICILAILFVSLFAADAFAPGLTIWQQLGAFFIHLIPSFILLSLLIVAWKWELPTVLVFLQQVSYQPRFTRYFSSQRRCEAL